MTNLKETDRHHFRAEGYETRLAVIRKWFDCHQMNAYDTQE